MRIHGPAIASTLLAWSAVQPRTPAPRAAAAAPSGGRPARLVLIDGHDGMRGAVHGFLTKKGFRCDAYADAVEALAAMTAEPPDLIVTEAVLPSMDGYQLLHRVKSDAALCGVPVVLLASRGMTSDRIAGYRAGAAAYVGKPFDPEELLAVVNAQLQNAILLQSVGVGLDVQTELRQMRQEMASVRQLLQVMLQVQARAAAAGGKAGVPSLPKQLAQLQQAAADGDADILQLALQPSYPPPVPSRPRAEVPTLTKRERTVLELVGDGRLNKEIASTLGGSVSHDEKYVRRLVKKTSTSRRTELVRRSLQLGLLTDHPEPAESEGAPHAEPLIFPGASIARPAHEPTHSPPADAPGAGERRRRRPAADNDDR